MNSHLPNMLKMRSLLVLILCLGLTADIGARELVIKSAKGGKKKVKVDQSKMMDCDPPVSYTEFSLNNIRFGLESAGQIWENNGDASYEVPKVPQESNEIRIHSLYAGALWIGGRSPDGQLKLAAVTYRTSGATDFYNGPLSNNNFATADYCDDFDTQFPRENLIPVTFDNNGNAQSFRPAGARLVDVQRHRAYFTALEADDGSLDELFPDGYTIPEYFSPENWPGNNFDPNYDFFLAPYFNWDDDPAYDPSAGDYPWFDIDNEVDCRSRSVDDPIPLFGDESMWWVFNDNGGIHTETGGEPIGMEIQAQAFAYNTTDEINNMSFYNYVLINRGTQTLQDCYFGQWVDPDVGCPTDDYVGCDVQRGLGYTYNGIENDASCNGVPGYGELPPAVGVDFFEGPYQDPDGLNNPLTTDLTTVSEQMGIPYGGIGLGYEDLSLSAEDPRRDNVVDNERFGMRRFVYYNRDDQTPTPNINGEPEIAIDFYNYLDGRWKTGAPMTYGGNGVGGSIPTDYMFPGLTDPVGFATNGAVIDDEWTEGTEGNTPGDRRFIQSAGRFVLEPGEFNNVTVGAVWVRPFGNTEQTLNALRIADDKAQSLFDNCFRILSGPDAPDVAIEEIDQGLIIYLSNDNSASNNFNEEYGFGQPEGFAFDPLIPSIDCELNEIPDEGKYYEFQGYLVYQLKNQLVSSSELRDTDLARLQFQCDIQDGVSQIINHIDDAQLGIKVPQEMVNGADQGIQHSFLITEDLFATGETELVNNKAYYFMVVAYAYNEWSPYDGQLVGDPCGQPLPYLESRKSATGEIPVITGLPHKVALENGGTELNSEYGDLLQITRLEGQGNGGNIVELTDETVRNILNSPDNQANELVYEEGLSPINVKVFNPVDVQAGNFRLHFYPDFQGLLDSDYREELNDVIEDEVDEDEFDLNNLNVDSIVNEIMDGNKDDFILEFLGAMYDEEVEDALNENPDVLVDTLLCGLIDALYEELRTDILEDISEEWEIDRPQNVKWYVVNTENNDTVWSTSAIDVGGEQLLVEYGISVTLEQYEYINEDNLAEDNRPDVLGSSITYEDPNFDGWLFGVPDVDGNTEQNWIRAGGNSPESASPNWDADPTSDPAYYYDYYDRDPQSLYENLVGEL